MVHPKTKHFFIDRGTELNKILLSNGYCYTEVPYKNFIQCSTWNTFIDTGKTATFIFYKIYETTIKKTLSVFKT